MPMRGKVVLITGGYDHTIRFWEVHSGMCCKTLQYPDSPINLLRVSPDKKWLAVAGNPLIRLFKTDMAAQGHTHSFEGHSGNVTSLVFSPPGDGSTTLWTGSEDHSIKVTAVTAYLWQFWDTRAASSQKDFKCRFPVNTVALHPVKQVLISGDQGGNIRLWDLRMGRCIRELLPEADSAIRWLSFAPNGGFLAAVNNAGSCFIWKISIPPEGNATEHLGSNPAPAAEHAGSQKDEENAVTNKSPPEVEASIKPPGVAGNEGLDMRPLKQIQAHQTYALKCLFSPDSRLLATTSADHTVKLWSLPSFKQEHTFTGHQRWVWDCEFSSDSNFLVTGSSDTTARSWNLALGDTICHFNGHHKAITSVALCDTTSAS